jgi:hypothetical protein
LARARAKNEGAARKRYVDVLQRSLGCICREIWITRTTLEERDAFVLTTSMFPVALKRENGAGILLSAQQRFRYVPDPAHRGEVKCQTLQYIYTIAAEADPDRELLEWHWHPDVRLEPHLHLHATDLHLGELDKYHIPTGRVSFEEVARFLIKDLGVPGRGKWEKVLAESQTIFEMYRTWPAPPRIDGE